MENNKWIIDSSWTMNFSFGHQVEFARYQVVFEFIRRCVLDDRRNRGGLDLRTRYFEPSDQTTTVYGNKMVDQLAKNGRIDPFIGPEPFCLERLQLLGRSSLHIFSKTFLVDYHFAKQTLTSPKIVNAIIGGILPSADG